ncbi:spliceosome-associated protein 130 A [Tanacetum coccineum]
MHMLQHHIGTGYKSGIRHIREDGRINEWRTPGKRTIVKLMEVEKNEMSGDVTCLDIAPVPEGRQRSRFLAVGSYNNTIRILSLDPHDCLSAGRTVQTTRLASFLMLACKMGSSSVVDMVTGQLSDARSRFLGLRGPKLFSILVRGRRAMLCLSSRPWLGYVHQGHFLLTPLSYETLEYAASFSSDECVEGVVVVVGDALRVFTLERLGETFNETTIPLCCWQGEKGKMEIENGGDDEDKEDPLSDEQYGYPKVEADKWVSCIRVLDPRSAETTCLLELQDNVRLLSSYLLIIHD